MKPTIVPTTTPKKRKNLTLANLQSNLSEKYIGITVVDSDSADVMATRQLRGRTSNGGAEVAIPPSASLPLENVSPSSQTTSPRTPRMTLHKNFVSPIDKLLLKNGSTSITPIRDSSANAIVDENQTSICTFFMSDCVDVESFIPFNRIEDDREKFSKSEEKKNRELSDTSNAAENGNDDKHMEVCEEKEEVLHSTSSVIPEITVEKSEDDVTVRRTVSQDENSEFGVELQNVNEADVARETEHDAHDDDVNKATSINIKSPSAVSLDSAKGSSVTNESAWMSYEVGDLYWGQIFSYCYWPCLVCPDPDERIIVTEDNSRTGEPQVLVHVRFFADNGRRNWVKSENLLPYFGLPSYQEYVENIRLKYGIKSPKYKLLLPKGYKKTTWYEAINEANVLVDVTHQDRLEKFLSIYKHTKAMQQIERRLSQTMHMPLELTSDFGSIYDSSEALSVRHLETIASNEQKRERSSSPFSPAYSPLKAVTTKRRKINTTLGYSIASDEISTENSKLHDLLNTNTQDAKEFKRFYAIMREFVMDGHSERQLEENLVRAVHNIWELREISQIQVERRLLENYDEQQLGSSIVGIGQNDGKMKRLSNRLRTFMVRRQTLTTPNISSPALSVTNVSQLTPASDKPKKVQTIRPIEVVVEDIYKLDRKYLFKGLGRDPICKYCYQSGESLQLCDKGCQSWLHPPCADHQLNADKSEKMSKRHRKNIHMQNVSADSTQIYENNEETSLKDSAIVSITCAECCRGEEPGCRICLKCEIDNEQLITCNMQNCNNKFHPGCCRYWPQAKITKSHNRIESFRCPSHVCHTCVSDDPKGKFQHISNAKLTKCVKCPASFHTDSTCIPAGSQILNAAYIICPRHNRNTKTDAAVNVNWCFICVGGGQLVCCETCPTAVHAQCLNIPIASHEAYICEECESGRMPLYGEMVWAKFNMFRWWPAIILPPPEVPQNILRKPHSASDFVVRFFGTHDHGWISRNRVYVYIEGDASNPPRAKSSMDLHYKRGIEEARNTYELVKTYKLAQRLKNEDKEKLHPQPYTRIKTNRAVPPVKLHVDLNKVNICDCRADDENPCGADSDCLNRVLYHECHPKMCPAGERCQNQMFESRISPRLEVVYMRERGFGLVCRESIAAGSFIIEYVGEIINHEEFQHRLAQKSIDRDENYYFFTVEKDYIIDAGPKGNLARFMNHSCEPNCETQKWLVNGLNRVGLFALKDIPENTELTFNYNWDELLGKQKKICYCGAPKCVGEIGGKYREDKEKNDVKLQPKSKGAQKKTAKPLKRLQKQQWKITPQQTKKSSKVNAVSKPKLNLKDNTSKSTKRNSKTASSEDLSNTLKE